MQRSKPFSQSANNGQLFGLALICEMSGERPSQRLGILDTAVAYAFDWMVAWQLHRWREEKEISKLEALAGAAAMNPAATVELIQ